MCSCVVRRAWVWYLLVQTNDPLLLLFSFHTPPLLLFPSPPALSNRLAVVNTLQIVAAVMARRGFVPVMSKIKPEDLKFPDVQVGGGRFFFVAAFQRRDLICVLIDRGSRTRPLGLTAKKSYLYSFGFPRFFFADCAGGRPHHVDRPSEEGG